MFASLDSFRQDVSYSVRTLARTPGFTLSAILAATLGIGSATAVFSVVDRILLRPLPYADPGRLVSVGITAPLDTSEFMFASEYFDLRRDPGPFSALTAFQAGGIDCDITEQNPVRQTCMKVEANFLNVLGVPLAAGRTFTAAEDAPHGPPAALISHGLWLTRFAADPRVIGRTLDIDGVPTTIAGVLPPGFEMPTLASPGILLPLQLNEATEREGRAFRAFARLRPGFDARTAREALQPHLERTLLTVPPQFRKEVGLRVQSLRDRQTGTARLAVFALSGAVLAVLLIACANIANLLLARGVHRGREIGMRAALGASRGRLIRQLMTESLLLSGLGGLAGSLLALGLLRMFVNLAPSALPRLNQVSVDLRALAFTVFVAAASGLAFGLMPALRVSAGGVAAGWRGASVNHGRLLPALVSVQVAASLVLLSGAGLLLRSLWNLQNTPLGMETQQVVTARFVLGSQRYGRGEDQLTFFRTLEPTLAALPGVTASAISDSIPPSGGYRGRPFATIQLEGQPRLPEGTGGMVAWRYITPGYFTALGIPLRRGPGFTPADRDPSAQSIVINETLARRLFPNRDPLGLRLQLAGASGWYTVIGVATDSRSRGPAEDPGMEYYLVRKANLDDPAWRNAEPPQGWRAASVVVRTALAPSVVGTELRSAIAAIDPTIPVEVETMPHRLELLTARPRFNAMLLGFFALTGLVLAAIGLYGVLSFLVNLRTREFGIRLALGATPATVLTLALHQAATWTLAGAVMGLAGAIIVARSLQSLLFGVKALDPYTLAAAVAVLLAAALGAALYPAARAGAVDPATTLRAE
jgi:predicted permease